MTAVSNGSSAQAFNPIAEVAKALAARSLPGELDGFGPQARLAAAEFAMSALASRRSGNRLTTMMKKNRAETMSAWRRMASFRSRPISAVMILNIRKDAVRARCRPGS